MYKKNSFQSMSITALTLIIRILKINVINLGFETIIKHIFVYKQLDEKPYFKHYKSIFYPVNNTV